MTDKETLNYFQNLATTSLQDVWKGRTTDPSIGPQYYYQTINLNPQKEASQNNKNIGLLGYACDAGVARNQGRVGSRLAPNAIRSRLARVAFHAKNVSIHDFGNITCQEDMLEQCQEDFSNQISKLISADIFPIAFGGGHDIAAAHFKGIWQAVAIDQEPRIGIINFDAHFDLRPTVNRANSGTPFYQILSGHSNGVKYMPIGIQQGSNTAELYELANKFQVKYIANESCNELHLQKVFDQIDNYFSDSDFIYITIDMDGFSAMYTPGVSAPSAFGFQPNFVVQCLDHIFSHHKVISCDLAECNPLYDIDNRTTTLAARLVDKIIRLV